MITNTIVAICTAYIATGHPCANGKMPSIHHTIALPRWYPLNSRVIIDGKEYLGEDRTNIKYNGRFDIFVEDKATAITFGKQLKTVEVISDVDVKHIKQ